MNAGVPARLALWAAAAALVASAHLAAAGWAMRRHVAIPPAPPEAIEIELAPPPAAPNAAVPPAPEAEPVPEPPAETTAQAPTTEDAGTFTPPPPDPLPPPDFAALAARAGPQPDTPQPDAPQPDVPQPDVPQPDVPQPSAAPDFAPPPVVPLAPPDFAALAPPPPAPETRAKPAATARKQPEKPKTQRKQPARARAAKPQDDKPAVTAQRQAAAQVRRADAQTDQQPKGRAATQAGRNKGAPTAAALGSAAAPAGGAAALRSWQGSAGARITAHMRRTRVGGARGSFAATLSVTVRPDGSSTARLARGTGDARVDAALTRQAARLPRLPPPPDGKPAVFAQPFAIQLR